jgi:hypothetical protein
MSAETPVGNPDIALKAMRRAHAVALKRIRELEAALWMYADPNSYYATSFLFDPPCGEFRDDFSLVKWSDYNRKMPGKLARRALRKQIDEAIRCRDEARLRDTRVSESTDASLIAGNAVHID